MVNTPLNNTWDWKVLLIECPMCGAAMNPEVANNHASWHWLTTTETTTL